MMLLRKFCKLQCFGDLDVMIFAIVGFLILVNANGIVASSCFGTCTDILFNQPNREFDLPTFPLKDDKRRQPSNIVKAHEIVCKGLQDFLDFTETDLGSYLRHLIETDQTFVDEYGQEIRHYHKIINWIWLQHNETVCKNYAITKYENDKLDLCSIARFLSHQPKVGDRKNIMKKMGVALGYKCHPCTPYKRKEYGENIAPNTDNISPDGVSPEESLLLCKDCDHQGNCILPTTTIPSSVPLSTPSTTQSAVALNPPSFSTPDSATTTSTEGTLTVVSTAPETSGPFDYSPCSYEQGEVKCEEISVEQIKIVFSRTAFPTLNFVDLTLQPYKLAETLIPENVFGNKRVSAITIGYPSGFNVNSSLSLQVHPEAFQSTKTYTKSFKVSSIDCSLLDFTFLSGFNQLTDLSFLGVMKLHRCFSSLPPLQSLTSLYFKESNGLAGLYASNLPTLTNGLKSITFHGETYERIESFGETYEQLSDALNDEALNRIMDWLLLSSSGTLETMTITKMKKLTQIPIQIPSFKALRKLWLYHTNISTIKTGALTFPGAIYSLYLSNNNIQHIEQGAFQGNFTDVEFNIDGNQLTKFDQNVFGPILQQMASGSGYINADQNPIDCGKNNICQLDWIRRIKGDPNIHCSDGTSFVDLEPAGFNHCSAPEKME